MKHLAGVWQLELCLNKSDKKGKVKCIKPDKHALKTDHLRLCNSYFLKIGSLVLKVTTVRSTPSESITERSSPLCTRQNLLSSLFFFILKFKVAAPNFVFLFFFLTSSLLSIVGTYCHLVSVERSAVYKAYLDVKWV